MNNIQLSVIGGSSVGTPVLLRELSYAVSRKALPKTHVRLFGRDVVRLQRIASYFKTQRDCTKLTISTHHDLGSALDGATHVLCQIRPGGMESRSKAEHAAMAAGIPGDEGLGPGGLALFLIGRTTIQAIADDCARYAPEAIFLQMSSPLGLFVAIAHQILPGTTYGVCELPSVTAEKVLRFIKSRTGMTNLRYSLAGLNHQSWLYDFRDIDDNNKTDEIINSIDDPDLVDIEPRILRKMKAIPVPYLRLFMHRARELTRQQAHSMTRGEELILWNRKLHHAYCDGVMPDSEKVTALLSSRDMNWYRDGIVPVLQKLCSDDVRISPINLPNQGAIQGIDDTAIVEVLCEVGNGVARPIKTAALPKHPARLTHNLVDYEQRALNLPDKPTTREIENVLALHPMVPRKYIRQSSENIRALIQSSSC